MKKYLPSILLFTLAFGMGLIAAATYPGPFATVYTLTSVILAIVSLCSAGAIAEKS